MEARLPILDFSDIAPRWGKNLEFVHAMNASSINATQVEIFLNAVMLKALREIDPGNKSLVDDIKMFMKQEQNHCGQHAAFNNRMYKEFVPTCREVEKSLRSDLSRFVKERSLKFNLAYSAGFENMALFTAQFVFEYADELFAGADPRAIDLWKWHLAEEYEHRTVAHDAFAALSGNWFWRMYGLFYAFGHLKKHSSAAREMMLATERAAMTEDEIKASKVREKRLTKRQLYFLLPKLLRIMMPFYNPGPQAAPKGADDILQRLSLQAPAAMVA